MARQLFAKHIAPVLRAEISIKRSKNPGSTDHFNFFELN